MQIRLPIKKALLYAGDRTQLGGTPYGEGQERNAMADAHAIHDSEDVDQDLKQLLDFLIRADELKQVCRETPTVDGKRRERTAEHCWHIALGVIVLHRYASADVDLARAVTLAVLHDLPEARAGDTFVFGPGEASRRAREHDAIDELLHGLPQAEAERLLSAWLDYEYADSPEARFVSAIDSLLPVFINLAGQENSSWKRHGLDASVIRKNVDSTRDVLPGLADLADRAINEGVRRGYLKESPCLHPTRHS